MIIALSFIIISVLVAGFSIYKINQIPKDDLSEKQNLYRIGIYSSLSAFSDFIMTLIICAMIPDGVYGTGVELFVALIVLVVYGPLCIITSRRLRVISFSSQTVPFSLRF